jgi:hypothetical protein
VTALDQDKIAWKILSINLDARSRYCKVGRSTWCVINNSVTSAWVGKANAPTDDLFLSAVAPSLAKELSHDDRISAPNQNNRDNMGAHIPMRDKFFDGL